MGIQVDVELAMFNKYEYNITDQYLQHNNPHYADNVFNQLNSTKLDSMKTIIRKLQSRMNCIELRLNEKHLLFYFISYLLLCFLHIDFEFFYFFYHLCLE